MPYSPGEIHRSLVRDGNENLIAETFIGRQTTRGLITQ